METAQAPERKHSLEVLPRREAQEDLDLSGLRAPDLARAIVGDRVLSPKAVVQLRELGQQFYAELELFIDKFSRAPNELGLNGRYSPNATVSHLDERCTMIIQSSYPLAQALPLSQGEAVLKTTAVELKAIGQDFRLFLRRHSTDGIVGEDMLPMIVLKCIELQHAITQPIDQLGAVAFAMLSGPQKEPRDSKARKADAA